MQFHSVLLLGCGSSPIGDARAPGEHPRSIFLEPLLASVQFDLHADVKRTAARLTSVDGLSGIVQSDSATIDLGDIAAAALTSADEVVLLDRTGGRVFVVDGSGEVVHQFGGLGSGPGEFRGANVLLVDPSDRIGVVDLQQRLQWFAKGDSNYVYQSSMQLPPGVRSMCQYDSELVTILPRTADRGLIVFLDQASGAVTRSFGRIYDSPNPIINAQVEQAYVACDLERGAVYVATRGMVGEVRAYSVASGDLKWRRVVSRFRSNMLRDAANGYTVSRSEEGIDLLLALDWDGALGLVAQYGELSPEAMRDRAPASVSRTVVFDPDDGQILANVPEWPRLLALRDRTYLALSGEFGTGVQRFLLEKETSYTH